MLRIPHDVWNRWGEIGSAVMVAKLKMTCHTFDALVVPQLVAVGDVIRRGRYEYNPSEQIYSKHGRIVACVINSEAHPNTVTIDDYESYNFWWATEDISQLYAEIYLSAPPFKSYRTRMININTHNHISDGRYGTIFGAPGQYRYIVWTRLFGDPVPRIIHSSTPPQKIQRSGIPCALVLG